VSSLRAKLQLENNLY